MKYEIILVQSKDEPYKSVIIEREDGSYISFPAEVGNPNYDNFLVEAELTDEQVNNLPIDVWYDFP